MIRIPQSAKDRVAAFATMAEESRILASATVNTINGLSKQTMVIQDADEMKSALHEIERLREVQNQHQKKASELGTLAGLLGQWLAALPESAVLELTAAPLIKLKDGETFVVAVERLREKIDELRQEQMRVKGARAPTAELKRRVRDYVDERAARGRPRINTQGGRLEIDFAPSQFSSGTTRHLLDVVCWLDPERLTMRLEAEVDALPDNGPAFTADERDEQLRILADDLDRLERREESLINSAEEKGQTIARRQQASPAAILSVTGAKAKAKRIQAA